MFEDIFDYCNWEESALGIWWGDTTDAAKHHANAQGNSLYNTELFNLKCQQYWDQKALLFQNLKGKGESRSL